MSKFSGKVLRNAQKQEADRIKSDAWLHNAIKFDHNLRISSPAITTLFDTLAISGRRLDEKRANLETLVANLIHGNKIGKPIRISYDRKNWNPRYHRAKYSTLLIMEQMADIGFIRLKKGFKSNKEGIPPRWTRIWATEALLESCPELTAPITREPLSLVEVRDEEKNLLDFRPTEETNRVEKILKLANDVNSKAVIRYKKHTLHTNLVAIYVRKLSLYGRLHTRGYRHYQGLKNRDNERLDISINGSPVVELDYSALHPFMLYANEQLQYKGDPYDVIENDRRYRKLYKTAFLALMNSSEDYKAERAINNFIINHWKEMQKLGISNARPIMDAIMEAHKPIRHYFCSGDETGLRIMNKDAKIALNVVRTFVRKGIPILAVHDSFIVEEQYEDLLHTTMKTAYQQNMKGYEIEIKKEFRGKFREITPTKPTN